MLHCKTFEVRDRSTFIPCYAVLTSPRDLEEADHYLLRRAGYGEGRRLVILGRLDCPRTNGSATYDPFAWDNRTMRHAHHHVEENWDSLQSGAVIDVEYMIGESATEKKSERLS